MKVPLLIGALFLTIQTNTFILLILCRILILSTFAPNRNRFIKRDGKKKECKKTEKEDPKDFGFPFNSEADVYRCFYRACLFYRTSVYI